jgi:hypothetical protein
VDHDVAGRLVTGRARLWKSARDDETLFTQKAIVLDLFYIWNNQGPMFWFFKYFRRKF